MKLFRISFKRPVPFLGTTGIVLLFLFAVLPTHLLAADFKCVDKPRVFRFPYDHGSHPDFKTEWWYVTGNLRSAKGRRWGFQITIFRQGLMRTGAGDENPWKATNLYMLNVAISDIKRNRFLWFRDIGRAGPGICGAKIGMMDVWMKTARMVLKGDRLLLTYKGDAFSLHMSCRPLIPPILNGDRGLSRKGPQPCQATYYYSLPALKTEGTIQTPEGRFTVLGISWFDHEFGSSRLSPDQAGWDWVSLHLSDGSHLMVYQIRRRDGTTEAASSATFIRPNGTGVHLGADRFRLTPLPGSESVAAGVRYPLRWKVKLIPLDLELTLAPWMKDQAWPGGGAGKIPYWEGAIEAEGVKGGQRVSGEGYLELTGYGASRP